MTHDAPRHLDHHDDPGIPTLTVRQPAYNLPVRTDAAHSLGAAASQRATAVPDAPYWHVDRRFASRLPPVLTEEVSDDAASYVPCGIAPAYGPAIDPDDPHLASVSSPPENAPPHAEPVLRAALQAAIEDALDEAVAHLRVQLQARLPEIVAQVLRQTRSG